MSDKPWYAHDHKPPGVPRARRAGEVAWRLVDDGGHVQSCELHDDSRVGAGWDVMVLLDGGRPSPGAVSISKWRGTTRTRSSRTRCAPDGASRTIDG
jgi:hypothetical protein